MRIPTTYPYHLFACALLSLALLQGCSSEKVIEVDLPPYETQMMVECFLEPGQNFQLNLQESVSYFSDTIANTIDNALVVISHNGTSDTLQNQFYFRNE